MYAYNAEPIFATVLNKKNVHSRFNYTPKTMNKEGAISIESHRNNNILQRSFSLT